ncbi:MAG: hypothetical protein L0K34_01700 [Ancrocorticia sp.]|nr:hypothetical protein [Ancrocorticia sp.]
MQQSQEKGSTLRFIVGVLIGIAIFAGAIVAMGGRWENVDLTPEEPTAEESARQSLAVEARNISDSAQHLLDSSPDSMELAAIHDTASAYVEQLGGVWVPWPSGAPSGYTNPPLETAAPAEASGDQLLTALEEFSDSALATMDSAEPESQTLLASMALSSKLLAGNYADSRGSSASCGELDITAAAQVSATPELLTVADNSRQWIETDTARMDSDSREAEVARVESLNSFIEAMLATGLADDREAFAAYPTLSEEETYTQVGLSDLSSSLVSAAASASGDDRSAIISYACSLYVGPAERSAALPFPGLTTP